MQLSPTDEDRNGLNESVRHTLAELDGTDRSAVRLLTGLTDAQLDDLGGF